MPVVLTISGSLRTGSSNSALLAAAALVAPPGVTVLPYRALADIPMFDPDVEQAGGPLPEEVMHWRRALTAADAVLISSPEYPHGVAGVMKNALDWVVGSGEFYEKPVGLLSASAASSYAHPQLAETLRVMSALLVPEAVVVLDVPRRGALPAEIAEHPVIAPQLRALVAALVAKPLQP